MIAVIFEVEPHDGKKDRYLDTAAELRPLLDEVDGFLSIERFASLVNPGKILSLSFWRDEQAIETWRQLERHRQAQVVSRNSLFKDYRLRVANVVREYGLDDRDAAPVDSRALHG